MTVRPGAIAHRPAGFARRCATAVLFGVPTVAWAVLGGDLASVGRDQARLQATQRATALQAAPSANGRALALADGSSVTEYLSAQGVVYAVTWSTRFKPDLEALLGAHASGYTAAAGVLLRTPGIKRHVVVQHDDLVVESNAHLGNFSGRAYLRSLVPREVSLDALR